MKRFVLLLTGLLIICGLVLLVLIWPRPLDETLVPEHQADLQNGETMFWAGGCPSCHAVPGAEGDAKFQLAGGLALETPFGVFKVPNISPDREHGIGAWSVAGFIHAMRNGVSPEGSHYYPAFPYSNYRIMPAEDLIDLKAFIDTLPSQPVASEEHELRFPFNIRLGLGLWKLLYLRGETFTENTNIDAKLERGRFLVNGPGHCSACHTPRDAFGGEIRERFLAGADPLDSQADQDGSSEGKVPNITPHKDGLADWSEQDIAYALESGFDPDFDSFGGSMVEVQENMAHLSPGDREAIAAYLKSLPPIPSEP